MRAIGASNDTIRQVFIVEGVLIGSLLFVSASWLRPRGQCGISLILYESHDGGQSWDDMQLTGGAWRFDRMVAFGPSGDLYATGMQMSCMLVHKGNSKGRHARQPPGYRVIGER